MDCPKCGSDNVRREGVRRHRQRFKCKACKSFYQSENPFIKILIFDIETAPIKALVWRCWKENINHDQILHDWYILCWAAKWLGDKKIISDALPDHDEFYKKDPEDDSTILGKLWNLMDAADVVVAHNAVKFDVAKVNTRFLLHGWNPPSPYKIVDTLKVARRSFGFSSNRLDALGQQLGLGRKLPHEGFELWKKCLEGNGRAWDTMVRYNKRDVDLLEKVYMKLCAWSPGHPNAALYVDDEVRMCIVCGSGDLRREGYAYTPAGKYQRFTCNDCGKWQRGRQNLMVKEKREKLNANIV